MTHGSITLLTFLATPLLALGSCASPATAPAPVELLYVGSSTVGTFVREASVAWPAGHFTLDTGPESDGGERAILESATDLAGVARDPRPETLAEGVEATLIGRDAIAVIVPLSLGVTDLSLEQLRAIFTGRFTNWSEVGGPSLTIRPLIVGPDSATRKVFREAVLGADDYAGCEVASPDGDLVATVAVTPGAIGQISFSFLADTTAVRAVAVEGTTPSVTNFDYPITRPLFLLWRAGNPGVEAFVLWARGAEGQRVVMRHFVGHGVRGSVESAGDRTPTGTLVVATETREVADGGVLYYPHRPYEILTRHGEHARSVRNHRGINDEKPTRIELEPGVYLIRTETRAQGKVEFFATVRAGRTTTLDIPSLVEGDL
jgi:phosphate transport system substrate-binding protein